MRGRRRGWKRALQDEQKMTTTETIIVEVLGGIFVGAVYAGVNALHKARFNREFSKKTSYLVLLGVVVVLLVIAYFVGD